MQGLVPAKVVSVDPAKKQYRVQIQGVTPAKGWVAEVLYPIGDDGKITDRLLRVDAKVWVEFMGGDSNHPIIVGHRNGNAANETAWRKIAHANIQLWADDVLELKAKTIRLIATERVEIDSPMLTTTGALQAQGLIYSATDIQAMTVSLTIHIHANTKSGSASEFSGLPKP
ncbi:MAG: phage baseplate assembly protein V [Pseudomonadota bacterium]|nr:phage baseplate assembly protein V [Pseudomonadota bacterium]